MYAIKPTVTSHFGANNISGVLATVLDILQVALQPIYSKLSDMTGRATAYTISLMFFLISFIVMACANDYNTLIVSRNKWTTTLYNTKQIFDMQFCSIYNRVVK